MTIEAVETALDRVEAAIVGWERRKLGLRELGAIVQGVASLPELREQPVVHLAVMGLAQDLASAAGGDMASSMRDRLVATMIDVYHERTGG